tara:strand:+ start:578 stop:1126 length:549 start_codon:yes stop_codon:yes gene_type:complete
MKKYFGIVILSFLISVNTYASSNKIHLICTVKATDTKNNTGKMVKLIPQDSKTINVNYIKIDKSKDKLKIDIWEHYAGILWTKSKPQKVLSIFKKSERVEKAAYKNKHYLYNVEDKIFNGGVARMTFDIYKDNGKWFLDGSDYFVSGSELGNKDYLFSGECAEVVKKDFFKIKKKGINNYKK